MPPTRHRAQLPQGSYSTRRETPQPPKIPQKKSDKATKKSREKKKERHTGEYSLAIKLSY
jgi:hypothetical protein